MAKIDPLDLTARQVRTIEEAVGKPMTEWSGVPQGQLLPLIIAAVEGVEPSTYADATMRELRARIVGDEDAEGNVESARP